ncbi:putative two-component system response regulator [Desulfocicer vacuolatum DSM 3385]|uniref:Putative two-component system response regulator n=1 Tax=Desulfocicer vacuolatum DSM 3385 TaxID=1121400 RepID=A0A1W2B6Q6_9BACT|nr:response regulator [Desulfocicer vacuolatum]SMC68461.1 putative two-component system response regulator [Desulfocicer vacuolatum DSM 3385]
MDETSNTTTIMVVDDTPANLRLLQNMLQTKGYRVVAFPSGRMALKAAGRKPPDLIMLDIMMPDMDGFEVCRNLKADRVLKEIPVLFISALSDSADKVRAFSSGGVDYVTKPFQLEEVLARVETHLHLRRLQLELKHQNLYLENLVQEKIQEISISHLATIRSLSKLVESRDDDTGHHIERTMAFNRVLAKKLKEMPLYKDRITDVYIYNLYHASPLHDIGKVGIPDHILLKPGRLTLEECEVMKTHTVIGAETLEAARSRYPNNDFVNLGIDIARSHHEKWDGSGYPDGLAGEDIPLCARIMAISDVYDALRSIRPYKPGFDHGKACGIILEGRGQHFDPDLVKAFMEVHEQFYMIHDRMGNDGD